MNFLGIQSAKFSKLKKKLNEQFLNIEKALSLFVHTMDHIQT